LGADLLLHAVLYELSQTKCPEQGSLCTKIGIDKLNKTLFRGVKT